MSIKRVEIKDFLVFKGMFTADFSQGVNVLIGGNGTGKTTLLRALTFAVNEQGTQLLNAIVTSNTEYVLFDVYHEQPNKPTVELTDTPQSLVFVPSAFDVNFMIKTNRKITNPSPITNKLMTIIREITNIETTDTKDSFRHYIIRNDELGKILLEQESSGYLKLDILFQMLKNGWVEAGAVLLWDEPENSLNPELVPVLVTILLELSKNGVQIFIATSDYDFARYFDVRKDRSVPVIFHNLTRTQQGIQCDSAPEYLSVPNNLLEKASEKLFDAVIDSAMEGQGDDATMKYQTNYSNEKSNTCLSRTGEPLTVYRSESEALVGAKYVNTASLKLVPYKCPKCGMWHLSPADRITPNTMGCRCKDSHHQPKALYKTKESAQQRAKIILEEHGQKLYEYPCPSHRGWHLSHTKY